MGFLEKVAVYFSSGETKHVKENIGRNYPCWCGSGKKYKKCHLHEDEKTAGRNYQVNCGLT